MSFSRQMDAPDTETSQCASTIVTHTGNSTASFRQGSGPSGKETSEERARVPRVSPFGIMGFRRPSFMDAEGKWGRSRDPLQLAFLVILIF